MITSNQNEQIKDLRKLQDKKHRTRSGHFVAEGEDLVAAALAAGQAPIKLFCTPSAPDEFTQRDGAELVEAHVLDQAAALGSGSRVIGVFEQRWTPLSKRFKLAVYLDAVADPGNVGTVLRSALAFADGPVILGPGCADPFSPKAVRAAMGAVFARPPARSTVAELVELGIRMIALDAGSTPPLNGTQPLKDLIPLKEASLAEDLEQASPTIVCIGAERFGIGPELRAAASEIATIPMLGGGPDSLNAAVAAGIALYELGGALQSAVHDVSAAGEANGITKSTEN